MLSALAQSGAHSFLSENRMKEKNLTKTKPAERGIPWFPSVERRLCAVRIPVPNDDFDEQPNQQIEFGNS